jgi:hypothetical protein
MASVRSRALLKLGVAFVVFAVVIVVVRSLRAAGESPGKINAIAVLPVAVGWSALIELLSGIKFTELAPYWKALPWWKQWPYAILLFFAFFCRVVLVCSARPV